MGEPTYNHAISTNPTAYFARANKVVKPSSRNSSPRNLGRRKTTTAAPTSSRTRSVVDHFRSSTQLQNSEAARSRPVSWHPDCFDPSQFNLSPAANGQDFSCNFATTQVNGLITPISYPSMNEPQIHELFTPLDELPTQDSSMAYEKHHFHDQLWLDQGQQKTDAYAFPLYSQQAFMQPSWQFNQVMTGTNMPTAPSSPDCPPIQNIRLDHLSLDNNSSKSKAGSEELVGMGLYDSPAEAQSSSMIFWGTLRAGRKGLKLEESFEPEEREDEDEEESEDDDQEPPEAVDEGWISNHTNDYDAQSIATHLSYDMQPQSDPLASQYLATLRQMNSAYYPSEYHGYGWI